MIRPAPKTQRARAKADIPPAVVPDTREGLQALLIAWSNKGHLIHLGPNFWSAYVKAFTPDETINWLKSNAASFDSKTYLSCAARITAAHLYLTRPAENALPLTLAQITHTTNAALSTSFTQTHVDVFTRLAEIKKATPMCRAMPSTLGRTEKRNEKRRPTGRANFLPILAYRCAMAGLDGEATIRVLNFTLREVGSRYSLPTNLLTRATSTGEDSTAQKLRASFRRGRPTAQPS